MGTSPQTRYEPLSVETLPDRLADVSAVTEKVGRNPDDWQVAEVGDGNLNLVFIITGPSGQVVVKQALPYVRLVGDSERLSAPFVPIDGIVLVLKQIRAGGAGETVRHARGA